MFIIVKKELPIVAYDIKFVSIARYQSEFFLKLQNELPSKRIPSHQRTKSQLRKGF